MSVSRVAKERRDREPETAPRSGFQKRESITVDKTDYINVMKSLADARDLSRDLWEQLRHFEKICKTADSKLFNGVFGCEVSVIAAGFREGQEQIGHVLQRGLKGKAYKR